MLYSQEESKKDVVKAYLWLNKACIRGVTFFEQLHQYFKENYAELKATFIEMKKPPSTVDQSAEGH